MTRIKAKLVNGEFRCGATPRCPGRLGRLYDASRVVGSKPSWTVNLGYGWVFHGWQMSDDLYILTGGGRWEATAGAQREYDKLRPVRAAGKLSPEQKERMRQGPPGFAQQDRYTPRYRALSLQELNKREEYGLGLEIHQQASYLPTVVLCYECKIENLLEAPSNSGR